MGCYDTILVPCPECGKEYDAQSKSGDCLMRIYSFNDCPEDVMINVNRHAPFVCFKCGTTFEVEFNPNLRIVKSEKKNEDFPELPDNFSLDDIEDAFVKYQEKISKK
jgi:hypothetical protein